MPLDEKAKFSRLSPKGRWQEDKARVNRWLDWCALPDTHEALATALAEYAMGLTASVATDAAAHHYKLEGAKGLIHTLLNLAEQAKPLVQHSEPQLKAV